MSMSYDTDTSGACDTSDANKWREGVQRGSEACGRGSHYSLINIESVIKNNLGLTMRNTMKTREQFKVETNAVNPS